ncbi:unnamed protein product [Amoebophrya sp. A120]|nr:unnamed protein product [Amoebophrya sp. A120]|eukprot:GSA120T00015670001.1
MRVLEGRAQVAKTNPGGGPRWFGLFSSRGTRLVSSCLMIIPGVFISSSSGAAGVRVHALRPIFRGEQVDAEDCSFAPGGSTSNGSSVEVPSTCEEVSAGAPVETKHYKERTAPFSRQHIHQCRETSIQSSGPPPPSAGAAGVDHKKNGPPGTIQTRRTEENTVVEDNRDDSMLSDQGNYNPGRATGSRSSTTRNGPEDVDLLDGAEGVHQAISGITSTSDLGAAGGEEQELDATYNFSPSLGFSFYNSESTYSSSSSDHEVDSGDHARDHEQRLYNNPPGRVNNPRRPGAFRVGFEDREGEQEDCFSSVSTADSILQLADHLDVFAAATFDHDEDHELDTDLELDRFANPDNAQEVANVRAKLDAEVKQFWHESRFDQEDNRDYTTYSYRLRLFRKFLKEIFYLRQAKNDGVMRKAQTALSSRRTRRATVSSIIPRLYAELAGSMQFRISAKHAVEEVWNAGLFEEQQAERSTSSCCYDIFTGLQNQSQMMIPFPTSTANCEAIDGTTSSGTTVSAARPPELQLFEPTDTTFPWIKTQEEGHLPTAAFDIFPLVPASSSTIEDEQNDLKLPSASFLAQHPQAAHDDRVEIKTTRAATPFFDKKPLLELTDAKLVFAFVVDPWNLLKEMLELYNRLKAASSSCGEDDTYVKRTRRHSSRRRHMTTRKNHCDQGRHPPPRLPTAEMVDFFVQHGQERMVRILRLIRTLNRRAARRAAALEDEPERQEGGTTAFTEQVVHDRREEGRTTRRWHDMRATLHRRRNSFRDPYHRQHLREALKSQTRDQARDMEDHADMLAEQADGFL